MRSRDQLAVIEFLKENPMATARKIERCMGWSNRHTHQILSSLKRRGFIKNVGKPRNPEFRLVQRWQLKMKIKTKKPVCHKPSWPAITELCRQHWQGYSIHKIFGSGGRA